METGRFCVGVCLIKFVEGVRLHPKVSATAGFLDVLCVDVLNISSEPNDYGMHLGGVFYFATHCLNLPVPNTRALYTGQQDKQTHDLRVSRVTLSCPLARNLGSRLVPYSSYKYRYIVTLWYQYNVRLRVFIFLIKSAFIQVQHT